jgi:V8-like Glu-specific endopeptidase
MRALSVCIGEYIEGGDSGSPAWIQGTGTAVGIMVTGFDETESSEPLACFEPLMPYPGWGPDSAVLTNDGMAPLHLVTGVP